MVWFVWSFSLTRLLLPIPVVLSLLMPGLQPQELVGVFGREYQTRYDQCVEQSSIQQEKISDLRVALSEAEVKLKDVDVFRDSLEQREDVFKTRENNLKQREKEIDSREQLLEQKIFDFTQQVEKVAKDGGKAEQIIANNEMLRERVEEERLINSKLQGKIDRNNEFILIIEATLLIIIFSVVISGLFIFINWLRGRKESSQSLVIDLDESIEGTEIKNESALVSSDSDAKQ